MTPEMKHVLWAIDEIEREGEEPVSLDSLRDHVTISNEDLMVCANALIGFGYINPQSFEIASAGKAWLEYHAEQDDGN